MRRGREPQEHCYHHGREGEDEKGRAPGAEEAGKTEGHCGREKEAHAPPEGMDAESPSNVRGQELGDDGCRRRMIRGGKKAHRDEAADVAQKIVDYIALMEICNDYTFAVAGANIVMTAKAAAANDSTLNIAYDNGTCEGLTSDADSADTTAGVAPKVNVQVDGDGVATTADPFKANNAYTPDEVYALDCKGASKAKVYVDVYVTDFRSAPALSFIPFYKKQDADEYAQGILQAVTLLTASGKSLRQVFDLDVDGADGLVLLVDAISGQDASVNFYVELVA